MDTIKACRICHSGAIEEILNLGAQPYANSLLESPDQEERFYPLSLSWCPDCNLVQLNQTAEPADLFGNYVWVTSTSKVALEHARHFYREIIDRTQGIKENYVLEVASNDGAFLQPFAENGYKVLGVDPARNIVEIAMARGIPTRCMFFGVKAAEDIIKEYGPAKVVIARNVLPHVASLHDFIRGLGLCLKKDGLLVVEFHYAKVIYEGLHYDSIYHEHLCYFTLRSIERLLGQHNLFIADIGESPISGGSVILYIKNKRGKETPVVQSYRNAEEALKVNELSSWQNFSKRVYSHRRQLLEILKKVTRRHGPMVGYGASARSSTLLNFCGIDGRLVSVIADQNPLKHQHYTAGTHIPITGPDEVMKQKPEYVLILAWNFADEIGSILKGKYDFTGTCIVPLPNVPRMIGPGS
jgi:SAM-dependent methyltransferase